MLPKALSFAYVTLYDGLIQALLHFGVWDSPWHGGRVPTVWCSHSVHFKQINLGYKK